MAAFTPAWLPPLNSGHPHRITVQISQSREADFIESVNRPRFEMNFRAFVDFISDKKDTAEAPFRGLQIRKYAYILCDYAKSGLFSQSLIGELSTCLCCFILEGDVAWEERHFSDEVPSFCELSEETDVFNKIEGFLRGMMEKEYNVGKNVLMFDMTIRKMVTIPDEQLKSWNSWYNEKNRSDPNFEYGFRQTIRRPRTAAELMEELRLASRGTSLKSHIPGPASGRG